MKNIAAVVLAAGRGTRIKATNNRNKVVYDLVDQPMIGYSIDNLLQAGIEKIVVVVGYAQESVKSVLKDRVTYAYQRERLGTGHAFIVGLSKVSLQTKLILCLYGDDSAFHPPNLYSALINQHVRNKADISLVTVEVENPSVGRIIRNKQDQVVAIVEDKNATEGQKLIKEINTGLYCFNHDFVSKAVKKIKKNTLTDEYYLTDVVSIAVSTGRKIHAVKWPDAGIWYGVNTKVQLQRANVLMQKKLLHKSPIIR